VPLRVATPGDVRRAQVFRGGWWLDVVVAGDATAAVWVKIGVTYLVPSLQIERGCARGQPPALMIIGDSPTRTRLEISDEPIL
jgi:hypothetical protein